MTLNRNSYTFREGLTMMAARALGIDPDLAVEAGESAAAVMNLIRHSAKLHGPARDAVLRDAERELRRISPRHHPELVEALHGKLMEVAGRGCASVNPATGAEEFFWPFDQLKDAASRVGRGIRNAFGVGSARAKEPETNEIEPIYIKGTRRRETLHNPSTLDVSSRIRVPDVTGRIAQRGLDAATSNPWLAEPKAYPAPGVERFDVRARDTSRMPIDRPQPPRDIPNHVFRKGTNFSTIENPNRSHSQPLGALRNGIEPISVTTRPRRERLPPDPSYTDRVLTSITPAHNKMRWIGANLDNVADDDLVWARDYAGAISLSSGMAGGLSATGLENMMEKSVRLPRAGIFGAVGAAVGLPLWYRYGAPVEQEISRRDKSGRWNPTRRKDVPSA